MVCKKHQPPKNKTKHTFTHTHTHTLHTHTHKGIQVQAHTHTCSHTQPRVTNTSHVLLIKQSNVVIRERTFWSRLTKKVGWREKKSGGWLIRNNILPRFGWSTFFRSVFFFSVAAGKETGNQQSELYHKVTQLGHG